MSEKLESIDEILRKRREREEAESVADIPAADAPDPHWLRDAQAPFKPGRALLLQLETEEQVASICEGEHQFCGFCGKPFPIWPMRIAAEHALAEHKSEMTLQGEQTYSMQCVPGMTQFGAQWVSGLLSIRVSMRRRAWRLGIAKEVPAPQPGGDSRIQLPGNKLPRRTN